MRLRIHNSLAQQNRNHFHLNFSCIIEQRYTGRIGIHLPINKDLPILYFSPKEKNFREGGYFGEKSSEQDPNWISWHKYPWKEIGRKWK